MEANMRGQHLFLFLAAMMGCASDDDGSPAPDGTIGDSVVFPADYETSYTEVRDCRQGTQHGPDIRVFANAAARVPYDNRTDPFPEGAILVKEEHLGNAGCTGPITQWTAMMKRAAGSSPMTLDWTWQQVDPERTLIGQDLARCYECHADCPEGHGGTCSAP